jgi:anionic cell wall polymer biosynthesis LytR-Cps2A-Psr (LCP) family protein
MDTLYKGKRSPLYVKAVQDLLGITLPFQVTLTLDRLCELVDLLDGVDLFIPDPVEVYEGAAPILLPPGVVRLDGDKCRLYATYSIPDEEASASAVRRQRLFLAILKRLGERKDFIKQPSVSSFFHTLLTTNMNHRTTDKLFNELSSVDMERLPVQTVAGNRKEVSGHPLIFPYYDGSLIKEIVSQSLSSLTRKTDGTLSDRVYTVQVLNGTVSSGMARKTADLLRGFGYDVISVGNADTTDYAQTQIIDRSGSPDMAQVFADVIHCPTIVTEARSTSTTDVQNNLEYKADFTIIIGKDFNGRYVVR